MGKRIANIVAKTLACAVGRNRTQARRPAAQPENAMLPDNESVSQGVLSPGRQRKRCRAIRRLLPPRCPETASSAIWDAAKDWLYTPPMTARCAKTAAEIQRQ